MFGKKIDDSEVLHDSHALISSESDAVVVSLLGLVPYQKLMMVSITYRWGATLTQHASLFAVAYSSE